MDYTVHGILQARILDWVAFPFSRKSSQPGIEPRSPALQADLYQLSRQGSKDPVLRCDYAGQESLGWPASSAVTPPLG